MILRIQIIDENDNTVAQAQGPAWQPVQLRTEPGKPIICPRHKNSNGDDNGAYHIFTVTAQPLCTLVMGRSETPVQFPTTPSLYPPINIPGQTPISGYPSPTRNPLGENPNQR